MKLSSLFNRRSTLSRMAAPKTKIGIEVLESRIAPAAVLNATKVDVFAPGGDVNGDGNFDPGDTILYTVTITNAGDVDLTGVTFNDLIDANTTLGAINASPLARNDLYTAQANTQLVVGSPTALTGLFTSSTTNPLTNDSEFFGDAAVGTILTSFQLTSTQGGSVSMVTSGPNVGSFSYVPAAGFTGVDTFTYTLRDDGFDGIAGNADDLSSVGTISISVVGTNNSNAANGPVVWYVDSSYAGANGASDGTSVRPFTALTSLNIGGDPDDTGDTIYLFESGASYTAGIILESTQTLIGEGTALVINGNTLNAAGTAPTISLASGTAITLGSGNTLTGFTIGNSQRDILGTNFGTLTVSNVTLNGTGKTLDLTTGSFAAGSAFNSVATTGISGLANSGHGMALISVGGSVNFGSTSIAGTTAQGIFVNASTADIAFGNTTVTMGATALSGVEAIRFETNTAGARSFGTLTLSGSGAPSGIGFNLGDTAGSVTVTGTANIDSLQQGALNVSGGATVSFQTLNIGTTGVVIGNGITLATHNAAFSTTGGAIQSVTGTDVNISGGTGAVTIANTITNAAGAIISIANHATGNITFSGNLSSTGVASGISVSSTSGTVLFSGATKTLSTGTNAAVNLINNSGTTNFTGGGLAITTTSGAGFSATGGGTVSVTGTGNTITSTTGTALNVANTNIGASGITFQSISSNGAASGIILNTTGAAGGLTVTGDGGGSNNGSGGTIQNSTASGILLSSTSNVSLARMNITNSGEDGIEGMNVTNTTFTRLNVTGSGDDSEDVGISFRNNLLGSNTWSNLSVTGSELANVFVQNDTGTLSSWNVSASTFSNLGAAFGGNSILVNMMGNAVLTSALFDGLTIADNGLARGLTVQAQFTGGSSSQIGNTTTNAFIVQNSTFTNNGLGASFEQSGAANLTFKFNSNNIQGSAPSHALNIASSSISTGGTIFGTVDGNTIGTLGVAGSGSTTGNGIRVFVQGKTDATLLINNNVIRETHQARGIDAQFLGTVDGSAAPTSDITITNNTVIPGDITSFPLSAIYVAADSQSGGAVTVRADVRSNTVPTSGTVFDSLDAYIIVDKVVAAATMQLVDTAPASATATAQLQSTNTGTAAAQAGVTLIAGPIGVPPLLFAPSPDDVVVIPTVTPPANEPTVVVEPPVFVDVTVIVQPPVIVPPTPVVADDGILSQAELDSLVSAAIARWEATGLTAAQSTLLHDVTFSVSDLPGWYLGQASGTNVTLDADAAGNAWFVDTTPLDDSEFVNGQATANGGAFGRVDALTTITHELGHVLGLADTYSISDRGSLMYGFIGQGERRVATAGLAAGVVADGDEHDGVEYINSSMSIGLLEIGKSVTVQFRATINSNITLNSVSNQGTVSGGNFANVLTDDPSVGGTTNPTVTIVDLPDVTVAVSPASVSEDGAGNLVYTFTREGAATNALVANFNLSGTADLTGDFTLSGSGLTYTAGASTGTITFGVGQTTATVTMSATDDTLVEADETLIITVTSGTTGYDIGTPAGAIGTISNDDTSVSVSVSPSTVLEDGAANLVYTFTRTGVTSGALSVNFDFNGTADFGTDFAVIGGAGVTLEGGTVDFAPGATTATITVDPTADSVAEGDEMLIVLVTAGAGYTLSEPFTATGVIMNDDAEVTLAILPSSVSEDGAGNLVYTFTRTGLITNALTVNVNVSGSASFTGDYTQNFATFNTGSGAATVTFGAGSSTATVTIDPTVDATGEADESVILTLAAGSGYSLGNPDNATGTITNDDTAVSVAVAPASATEAAGTLVYTFIRTGDTSTALVVNFTAAGVATLTNDYTQSGATTFGSGMGTITIPIGQASAAVTLTAVDDRLVEGSETAILTVAAGSGYSPAGAAASGSITDNDTATIGFTAGTSSALESDGTQNVSTTLTINAIGTGNIGLASNLTANLTTTGGTATGSGTDYTLPGTPAVTFAAGTYATGTATQNAVLTIIDDRLVESSETATLGLAIAQNIGTQASIGGTTAHTLTLTDNDTATIGFTAGTSSALESGGTQNVSTTLTINAIGTGNIGLASNLTANLTTTGGTATGTGTDYTLSGSPAVTFVAGTYATGTATQNAVVTITDDRLVESSETATLGLAIAQNIGTQASIGGTTAHTLTLTDNDTATIGFTVGTSSSLESLGTQNVSTTLTINAIGTGTIGLASNLTANLTTTGGTATGNGTDYTLPGSPAVTFAAGTYATGTASQNATVTVVEDTLVEGSETANLGLAIVQNIGTQATVGGTTAHVITITDNDVDLSITKTDGSATEIPGTSVTYTIVASNPGLTPVTSATVTDTFAGFLTGVTWTAVGAGAGTGSTAGAGSINELVSLPAGASFTYTVTGTIIASATGTLVNTATIAAPVGFTDQSTGNNIATDTDTLTPQGDLSITKTDGVATLVPGTNATYTIVVSNAGPSNVVGANVADTFAAILSNITFSAVGAGGATGFTANGSGNLNDTVNIPAGGSITYTVSGLVASTATGTLANTATITAPGTFTDTNSGNNSATDTDTLTPEANLSITKTDGIASAIPGTNNTYTITVSNAGPSNVIGATVADTFPAIFGNVTWTAVGAGGGTGTASGSGNISDSVNLPVGGSVTYTVTGLISASAAGTLVNTATITSSVTDPTPGNNTATDSDALTPRADLSITKTESADPVFVGNNLTYTLNYANNGASDAQGVIITDAIPSGMTFVSANAPGGWSAMTPAVGGTGTVTFTKTTSAAGESGEFTIVVATSAALAGTTVSNTATVSSETTDLTSGNNSSTVDTLIAGVNLTLSKTNNITVTTPGSTLTYVLSYANTGSAEATGVVITETLPNATSFSASNTGWVQVGTTDQYTFTIGTLAAGASATVNFIVRVNDTVGAKDEEVYNTATIADDGTRGSDINPSNNATEEIDTLTAAPDLQVSVVDDGELALRGQETTFTITYRNVGNQDSAGTVITQTVPANTFFASGASTMGWTSIGNNSYTLNVNSLTAGAAAQTATFTVFVFPSLPSGYNELTTTSSIANRFDNDDEPTPADNTDSATTKIYQGIYVVSPGISLPGRGAPPAIRVFDIASGTETQINAYESTYRKSIRVATGDINGDGYDDVITSTITGNGRVRVFDGRTGAPFTGVFSELAAFPETGARGAFVASGDVNSDGRDDIIVGSGYKAAGTAKVRIFSGIDGSVLSTNTPFGDKFRGGVRVAVAEGEGSFQIPDSNNQLASSQPFFGVSQVIASQGFGGNKVVITSGIPNTVLKEFIVGGARYKGGVFVAAAADLNNDGIADIIAGRDRGRTVVETFDGSTGALLSTITPFATRYALGARVAAADVNLDGVADIIVGSGGLNRSNVKIFDGRTNAELPAYTLNAFASFPIGAVFVAGSSPVPAPQIT